MSEETTNPKEYAIFWKNKETNFTGNGEPVYTKAEAEEIAGYMNSDPAWSHLEHWAGSVVAEVKE